MTAWTIAATAMVPALALSVLTAARGPTAARLGAVQLVTALAIQFAVMLSFVDGQASSIDLALALALLSLPATLLLALFEERWL